MLLAFFDMVIIVDGVVGCGGEDVNRKYEIRLVEVSGREQVSHTSWELEFGCIECF